MLITRRDLIRLIGGAAAAYAARGCASSPSGDAIFTGDQLAMLRGFADVVIPEDDLPGGAKLGAIAFIEQLITAFDSTTPAIFAGGPFSDRGGASTNDFANFIELDRVKEAAWRLTVLGGTGPNGPVIGIKDQLVTGLEQAIATSTKSIGDLAPDDFKRLFNSLDSDFQALVIELTIEGSFCAPEYGGNIDLAGWSLCHFEGDRLPLGYSASEVSDPNPSDPEPLTDDLRDTLKLVVTVLGGRAS